MHCSALHLAVFVALILKAGRTEGGLQLLIHSELHGPVAGEQQGRQQAAVETHESFLA